MKRLIVNADDFGLTRGVNAGIVRAFLEGILRSTTLMANAAAFEDAVAQARTVPGLAVGCHLVLVGGPAVAPREEVSSLAGQDGRLPASLFALVTKLSLGTIRQKHLEREIRAQIERVRAAGIEPTHLDTHKHTHCHPRVMEALGRVAREFGITRVRKPFEDFRNVLGLTGASENGGASIAQRAGAAAARAAGPLFERLARLNELRSPDHFFGMALTGRMGSAAVLRILEALPEGTSELMCHPGVWDEELERSPTRLKRQRETELAGLTDPAVRRATEERGIRLVNFRELD